MVLYTSRGKRKESYNLETKKGRHLTKILHPLATSCCCFWIKCIAKLLSETKLKNISVALSSIGNRKKLSDLVIRKLYYPTAERRYSKNDCLL